MGENLQNHLRIASAGCSATSRRLLGTATCSIFCLLLGFFLSTAGLAETRSANGGGWTWSKSADGHQITTRAGERRLLDLAAEAQLSDFVGSSDGWLATAIDPSSPRPTLKVLRGDGGETWSLPSPPIAAAELRSAVLVADSKGLHGLAWLEGADDRRLAVKSASWLGHAWSKVETVANPGPGSQLSLSSAKLADGSWLLVWSAFDGTDDEIVWSRRDSNGWSTPQQLGDENRVPDITPRLTTLPEGGALAAWSGYIDGHYHLHTARFAAGKWSRPEISGDKGTVSPSFESTAEGTFLLYRQAVPRAWVVVEVGAKGKLARRAELVSSVVERPLVGEVGKAQIQLRWPEIEGSDGSARWHTESP